MIIYLQNNNTIRDHFYWPKMKNIFNNDEKDNLKMTFNETRYIFNFDKIYRILGTIPTDTTMDY